jgi:hypothetical protein
MTPDQKTEVINRVVAWLEAELKASSRDQATDARHETIAKLLTILRSMRADTHASRVTLH